MLEAAIEALEILFQAPNPIYIAVGAFIGMVFGAIPGLGGVIALALLIPVTFGMDTQPAIILFGSTMGGVAFGGSISAILINVPGTAPNAATLLDGHPMTKQGRGGEALGISATASAFGAIFGLLVLLALLPVARRVVLAFTPPDFFWLAVFGLMIIAVVGRGNMIRSLIMGGVGLMLSFIGLSGVVNEYRFGFGTEYLIDGIQLIPVIIGVFAIAEVLQFAREGGTIQSEETVDVDDSPLRGVKQVLDQPRLFLQSSVIGTIVGMIPGAGGTVANFVSYMVAMQTSRDPDSFGTGNPKGVLASEAANDSKDGGSLLPTTVFGIPGSAEMVVLLGALTIHGLTPGLELLNENLHLLLLLIFSLLLSNIITSIVGILSASQIVKVSRIPVELLSPPILVISLVGSFALRNNLGDVILTLIFGFIGFAMIVYSYSRIILVLALILGPTAEQGFVQSLMISDSGYRIFFSSSISLILIFLIILVLMTPVLQNRIPWTGTGNQS